MTGQPTLLGFDNVLAEAETVNRRQRLDRESSHLPRTMEEAVKFHRKQIRTHHAAMLAADFTGAMAIRQQARLMAVRVNHGEPGILAGPDAPGCVLQRRCAAAAGRVPLWGQEGRFRVDLDGMLVLIALDGMFGIGSSLSPFLGFTARAVEYERPFISDTGFRSFLSGRVPLLPDITPDGFVHAVIAAHIAGELKGKLRAIGLDHRR
jgi:hypothetical protein